MFLQYLGNGLRYFKQILQEVLSLQLYICIAELRNGWHIISPVKSFTVYAATAMEKADWMMHVNRCVQDLRLKSMIVFSLCLICYVRLDYLL